MLTRLGVIQVRWKEEHNQPPPLAARQCDPVHVPNRVEQLIEVRINSMEMIGVADPNGTIRTPVVEAQVAGSLLEDMALIIGVPLGVVLVGVGITMVVYGRANDADASPVKSTGEDPVVLDAEALIVAELVDDGITDEG